MPDVPLPTPDELRIAATQFEMSVLHTPYVKAPIAKRFCGKFCAYHVQTSSAARASSFLIRSVSREVSRATSGLTSSKGDGATNEPKGDNAFLKKSATLQRDPAILTIPVTPASTAFHMPSARKFTSVGDRNTLVGHFCCGTVVISAANGAIRLSNFWSLHPNMKLVRMTRIEDE